MKNTDKIISLIVSKLQQATDEAAWLAPDEAGRVKIKRAKNPFTILSQKPEDCYEEDGIPIMLVPFEKLREELLGLLPKEPEL
jgi:hypothetical protein